jgi:protein-tyrosine kinase
MSIIEKAMGKRHVPHADEVVRRPMIADAPQRGTALSPSRTTAIPTPENRALDLPVARLKADGLVASNEPTQQVAEEYRRIKRPLLANAFGRGALRVERGNLIMVTSALPEEGKTAVSLNLALSIALERNHTVLLMDVDVTRREISRLYGLENTDGLTDVLLDDGLAPNQAVRRTNFPSLHILPAGRQHAHATELLASDAMECLLAELIRQDPNRIIICDCPPVLATNEPQALAHLVGQIVFVVEAGRTPQHLVTDAIATLDPSKAINLVLNKSRKSFGGSYYGDYGYGRYGYGAE